MEVRCGKCNKLFRVSDDKITGAGIKFPCTRCGEYIRITHEDFEHYTHSQRPVSVLDLFEQEPKPVAASLSLPAAESVAGDTAPPEQEPKTFDLTAQATLADVLEEKAPFFAEPDHLVSAPEPVPAVEIKPEPLMQSKPETVPPVQPQPEPKPEPLFIPQKKAKPVPERETLPEPDGTTPLDSPLPAAPIQPAVPRKEYARSISSPEAERSVREPMLPSTPSRSNQWLIILFITLIISGLTAYGIYSYLQTATPSPSSLQRSKEKPRKTVSIEGLQIVSPGGSVQANGDLLITGVIENTAEMERTAWYVVTEVYNAEGAVLSTIRLLNGKQIFSRSDYDILARRGVNLQDLKEQNLQNKGVIIPPKGRVNFELYYFEPPAGIASFVSQVLPFDPVQLQKEISEEIK